jgi:hypothetical protein
VCIVIFSQVVKVGKLGIKIRTIDLSLVYGSTLLKFVFGKFSHYGLGVRCNHNQTSQKTRWVTIKTIILLDIFFVLSL